MQMHDCRQGYSQLRSRFALQKQHCAGIPLTLSVSDDELAPLSPSLLWLSPLSPLSTMPLICAAAKSEGISLLPPSLSLPGAPCSNSLAASSLSSDGAASMRRSMRCSGVSAG